MIVTCVGKPVLCFPSSGSRSINNGILVHGVLQYVVLLCYSACDERNRFWIQSFDILAYGLLATESAMGGLMPGCLGMAIGHDGDFYIQYGM